MGGPTPYGQSQNRWIFLSPTSCKGGGHSFCPIHTKFSALNILNAQNCWVFFSETAYQDFPSAWALKLQSIMGEIWLIESYLYFWVLNYFFKLPHTLRHPRGLLLPLGTPCIKLHEGMRPLGWSGRRASKFIEYTVIAVKTCDKTQESANIFMF